MRRTEQESNSQKFLTHWQAFVGELETRYDWCLSEYENDLDSRVLLSSRGE